MRIGGDMCKEVIYWGAEILNYWALMFWGIKLFLNNRVLNLNRIWRSNIIISIVSIPIALVVASNYRIVTYSNVATYFLIICLYFLLKILCKEKVSNTFSLSAIYIFSMRLIDLWVVTIVTEVSRVSRHVNIDLTKMGIERAVFCVLLSVCYFCVYYFCSNKTDIIQYLNENTFYRRLTSLYSYLGNLCFCTVYRFNYKDKLIGYWTLYLVCAFVLFGTFLIYSLKNKSQEKEYLLNMRNDMMKMNYHGLKKAYDINKTLQHDYKNHLLAVSELIKEYKNEEALIYISKYIDYAKKPMKDIGSGNDILDIIVNSKITEAREKHILFTYDIEFLSKIVLEDIDMCALMANLLDNAIEECENIEENKPWIYLKLVRRNDMLLIQISNSIRSEKLNKKKFFMTEKNNVEDHGWGMKSIERVISKYGGTKSCLIESNKIEFFINIPI